MTEPLHITWDRTVIHSTEPGDDTIVCCLDQHGHPIALFLDDDLREALGLQLLLPDGDGEVDPQHLELARENEKLRVELANRVAAIAQVRETCARLYTDPDEENNPYRVGQDKMADLILEQLDEHSRALGAGQ